MFLFTFSGISPKFFSILLKIVNTSSVDFILRNKKKVFFEYFCLIFSAKFWLNFSKFSFFHQKLPELSFFCPL